MRRYNPALPLTLPTGATLALAPSATRPFAVVLCTPHGSPCAVLPCQTAGSALRRAEAMRGYPLQFNPLSHGWEALQPEETAP